MAHMTDPIADLFARLKNAQAQHHRTVSETVSDAGHPQLDVELKYYQGEPVIKRLSRVSKPGRRIYSPSQEIPMVANGLGITIVSTSKGVLSDTKARELNVGGEVLGQVF